MTGNRSDVQARFNHRKEGRKETWGLGDKNLRQQTVFLAGRNLEHRSVTWQARELGDEAGRVLYTLLAGFDFTLYVEITLRVLIMEY